VEGPYRVGETFRVTAVVHLGELQPEEVDVELYYGSMKSADTLNASQTQIMTVAEEHDKGTYLYACRITCNTSGRFGFTARVTPSGDDRIKFTPGFLTWA
jgi:starch phosphorylase